MTASPDSSKDGQNVSIYQGATLPNTNPRPMHAESSAEGQIDTGSLSQALHTLSLNDGTANTTASTYDITTNSSNRATPVALLRAPPVRTLHHSTSREHMERSPLRRSSRPSSSYISEADRRNPTIAISGQSATGSSTTQRSRALPASIPDTPKAIAEAHFRAELNRFHFTNHRDPRIDTIEAADVAVVIHDGCYGHRYERLSIVNQTQLDSYPERPERVQAAIIGVAAAYVKLGTRHAGVKVGTDLNNSEKLSNVPFQIHKTTRKISLDSSVVDKVHDKASINRLLYMCKAAPHKLANGESEIELGGLAHYDDENKQPDIDSKDSLNSGDLYLSPGSLEAMEGAMGAVCEAVDMVFAKPSTKRIHRAFAIVRPPGHHCSADEPSGFCWVNNVCVGVSHAFEQHNITHAAIIDIDLHHGDGTQEITMKHNALNRTSQSPTLWDNTAIGYFSLHDLNSFPCEDGDIDKLQAASTRIDGAHGQHIWNMHLQSYVTEEEFRDVTYKRYQTIIGQVRTFLHSQTVEATKQGKRKPKAIIFLSAGFDASEHEDPGMQRHGIHVPTSFYARFTEDVVKLSQEDGCAVEGRVVSVLEGGYSNRALTSGVMSHLSGFVGKGNPSEITNDDENIRYDTEWWSVQNLVALEKSVYPPKIAPSKSGKRQAIPTNYSSPTESFTAKINDLSSSRRESQESFPTPETFDDTSVPWSLQSDSPYPLKRLDVEWTIATNELARLLIPTDRETMSRTLKELQALRLKVKSRRQASHTQSPRSASATLQPETNTPRRTSTRVRQPKNAAMIIETTSKDGAFTNKPSSPAKRGRGRPRKNPPGSNTGAAPAPFSTGESYTTTPEETTSVDSVKSVKLSDLKPSYAQPTNASSNRNEEFAAISRPTTAQSTTSSQNSTIRMKAPSSAKSVGSTPVKSDEAMNTKESSISSSEVANLTGQMKKFTISLASKAQRLARAQAAARLATARVESNDLAGSIHAEQLVSPVTHSKQSREQSELPRTPDHLSKAPPSDLKSPVLGSTGTEISPMTPSNLIGRTREIPETPAFLASPLTPINAHLSTAPSESVASPTGQVPTVNEMSRPELKVRHEEQELPRFTSTGVIPFGTRGD